PPAAADQVGELAAEQRLHHEERVLGRLTKVDDLDDVLVLDRRGRASLTKEALDQARVDGELGLENLERDRLAQDRVLGEVHRAHAAVAESLPDAIAIRVRGA